jgi:hypothetical protein
MLSSPGLRYLAIKGLRRLNTDKSRRALFDLVKNAESLSQEDELALRARSLTWGMTGMGSYFWN